MCRFAPLGNNKDRYEAICVAMQSRLGLKRTIIVDDINVDIVVLAAASRAELKLYKMLRRILDQLRGEDGCFPVGIEAPIGEQCCIAS